MRPGERVPPQAVKDDTQIAEFGGTIPPKGVQSAQLVLRHILRRGQMRFLAPSMISQENRDLLANRVRYLIDFAKDNFMVRKCIAGSVEVWQDYTAYLNQAVEFFKSRMFLPIALEDPSESVTAYMCDYSTELIQDLERVNAILTLARIALWKSVAGQQLVFQCGTDMGLLRLLEICLRVSARSNDSDPINGNLEQLCSNIVNTCKQTLVTIMWLLNVFVENNSGRVLDLWIDIFAREKSEHLGTSAFHEDRAWGPSSRQGFAYHIKALGGDSIPASLPLPLPYEIHRLIVALKIAQKEELNLSLSDFNERFKEIEAIAAPINAEIERMQNTYNETDDRKFIHHLSYAAVSSPPFAKGFPRGITEILKSNIARCPWNPEPLTVELRQRTLKDAKRFLIEDLRMNVPELTDSSEREDMSKDNAGTIDSFTVPPTYKRIGETESPKATRVEPLTQNPAHQVRSMAEDIDITQGETSRDAQSDAFREQVIADLNAFTVEADHRARDLVNDHPEHDEELDEEESSEEDEDEIEDDERDPYGEAFKSRGIVSELPLVLGPSEIQALPLILKAGVSLSYERIEPSLVERVLKACQCHLLVMQDTGRHLLREMLIFIAAWDLNDEEPVYKAMLKVMESVLDHGLMPIAWHSFRETKDVVSPAQSILVKTLTHIFRLRRKGDVNRPNLALYCSLDALPDELTFEKAIIETLLDEFRSTVVPQTVALIWLQGQIRKKVCVADDFPLNLWDMERVYEGVYQFLELFAVLTETQCWKEMLIRHQLSFELISLLKELEESIDKGSEDDDIDSGTHNMDYPESPLSPLPQTSQVATIEHAAAPGGIPVSVERPYDPVPSNAMGVEPLAPDGQQPMAEPGSPHSGETEAMDDAQEASEFEWRNLKKLVVLVLSSLAYKSAVVKTQVKELGGVELVTKCFEYDRNNLFLKEHAVLCLNFLLEKSPESHAVSLENDAGLAEDASLDDESTPSTPPWHSAGEDL